MTAPPWAHIWCSYSPDLFIPGLGILFFWPFLDQTLSGPPHISLAWCHKGLWGEERRSHVRGTWALQLLALGVASIIAVATILVFQVQECWAEQCLCCFIRPACLVHRSWSVQTFRICYIHTVRSVEHVWTSPILFWAMWVLWRVKAVGSFQNRAQEWGIAQCEASGSSGWLMLVLWANMTMQMCPKHPQRSG